MSGLAAALAADDSLHGHVMVDRTTGFRYVVVCANCDNRKCMGCVLREHPHECEDDCPDCCPSPNWHVVGPSSVYLSRLVDECTTCGGTGLVEGWPLLPGDPVVTAPMTTANQDTAPFHRCPDCNPDGTEA